VQNRLAKFAARAREFYTLLSARNLNASSVLYSSQSTPMVFQASAISLKQILTAAVAAEFVVLGLSFLIMASRKRQHA
jgi:ABC-type nitrate/sulfonate/bicarbonate transport system permease component